MREVTDRLRARRPRLQAQGRAVLARLEKETSYLLRCCAGVQLTGDDRMLAEYTGWLRGVLAARNVSADLIDDLYAGAVETLATRAPQASQLIDGVRPLLAPRGPGAPADGRE